MDILGSLARWRGVVERKRDVGAGLAGVNEKALGVMRGMLRGKIVLSIIEMERGGLWDLGRC